MTRTDGERELVLGNKQLLSAFFVVVILMCVFFTMGYFVGKNTATGGFNAGTSAGSGGPRPDAAGRPLDSGSPSATVHGSTGQHYSCQRPGSNRPAPGPSPHRNAAPRPRLNGRR